MKNLNEYRKRFNTLLESKIGDVKPLITEVEETGQNKNGLLPVESIIKISDEQAKLHKDAIDSYEQMKVDAKKENITIKLTDKDSGYRPLGSQEKGCSEGFTQWCAWIRFKNGTGSEAASPGTSNHGWGRAIDVSGGAAKKWVKENGEKYGWCWGEAPSESWHFTFCGGGVNRTKRCDSICKTTISTGNNEKITIDELKNAWENILTPKVKFLFEDKPELLKSKSFDGTVNRDYHTRWTFAEHRFIGDGTNGVTLSLIGERQDNEEELSSYYYEISKGTEYSNSERKVLPMDDSNTTIIDSQTNEAVLKFKIYGSEFENWPTSRETGNFNDQAYNAIGL